MKMKQVCLVMAALSGVYNSALAQAWLQTSAPVINWSAVASSADGSRLVAAAGVEYLNGIAIHGGPIYASTNSGATWAPTSAPFTNWSTIASSADGSKLVAAAGVTYSNGVAIYGGIWTSADSGATWTPSPAPLINWNSVASSADGTKLVASSYVDGIYTSTNSGTTWTRSINALAANNGVNAVASSADGTTFFAASGFFNPCCGSPFFTSTNLGATWTASGPTTVWQAIASSAEGTKLIAMAGIGSVFTSQDSGATWAPAYIPWQTQHVASSADGSKLVAVGIYIYTSADSGVTWMSNSAPIIGSWSAICSSADGSKLVAAGSGGIWIWQANPTPFLNINQSSSNLLFSWIVPSADFVLQANSDLTTTNWAAVSNTPTLNLSNLQYQVTLPPASDRRFYRLKH